MINWHSTHKYLYSANNVLIIFFQMFKKQILEKLNRVSTIKYEPTLLNNKVMSSPGNPSIHNKDFKKLENKNTSWYQKLFLIKVFWSIPVLVYKCAMVIVIPLLINWSPFLFFRFQSLLTQNEGHGCFLYVWYVTLNLKTYHVCLVNQEFFFKNSLCPVKLISSVLQGCEKNNV